MYKVAKRFSYPDADSILSKITVARIDRNHRGRGSMRKPIAKDWQDLVAMSDADVAELRRGEVATEEALASREVDTTRLVRPASSERPRTGKRRRYTRRSPKLVASENDQNKASSDIESDSISDPMD